MYHSNQGKLNCCSLPDCIWDEAKIAALKRKYPINAERAQLHTKKTRYAEHPLYDATRRRSTRSRVPTGQRKREPELIINHRPRNWSWKQQPYYSRPETTLPGMPNLCSNSEDACFATAEQPSRTVLQDAADTPSSNEQTNTTTPLVSASVTADAMTTSPDIPAMLTIDSAAANTPPASPAPIAGKQNRASERRADVLALPAISSEVRWVHSSNRRRQFHAKELFRQRAVNVKNIY